MKKRNKPKNLPQTTLLQKVGLITLLLISAAYTAKETLHYKASSLNHINNVHKKAEITATFYYPDTKTITDWYHCNIVFSLLKRDRRITDALHIIAKIRPQALEPALFKTTATTQIQCKYNEGSVGDINLSSYALKMANLTFHVHKKTGLNLTDLGKEITIQGSKGRMSGIDWNFTISGITQYDKANFESMFILAYLAGFALQLVGVVVSGINMWKIGQPFHRSFPVFFVTHGWMIDLCIVYIVMNLIHQHLIVLFLQPILVMLELFPKVFFLDRETFLSIFTIERPPDHILEVMQMLDAEEETLEFEEEELQVDPNLDLDLDNEDGSGLAEDLLTQAETTIDGRMDRVRQGRIKVAETEKLNLYRNTTTRIFFFFKSAPITLYACFVLSMMFNLTATFLMMNLDKSAVVIPWFSLAPGLAHLLFRPTYTVSARHVVFLAPKFALFFYLVEPGLTLYCLFFVFLLPLLFDLSVPVFDWQKDDSLRERAKEAWGCVSMDAEELLEEFVAMEAGWEGWIEEDDDGYRQFMIGQVDDPDNFELEKEKIYELFRKIYNDGKFVCSICLEPLYEFEFGGEAVKSSSSGSSDGDGEKKGGGETGGSGQDGGEGKEAGEGVEVVSGGGSVGSGEDRLRSPSMLSDTLEKDLQVIEEDPEMEDADPYSPRNPLIGSQVNPENLARTRKVHKSVENLDNHTKENTDDQTRHQQSITENSKQRGGEVDLETVDPESLSDSEDDDHEDEGHEEEHCHGHDHHHHGHDHDHDEGLSLSVKNAQDIVHRTHCGHFFHKSCLQGWLETKQTCPNCRKWIYVGDDILLTLQDNVGF